MEDYLINLSNEYLGEIIPRVTEELSKEQEDILWHEYYKNMEESND
jgi:hypothetical protein